MQNKPRYSRISDILDLAIFMASNHTGITLSDIIERYNVSRRTAERMRDSLFFIFPSIDEIKTGDKEKHFGFINFSIKNLVSFDNDDITYIEQAANNVINKEIREKLLKISEKIKAITYKNTEYKSEFLVQAESFATRQMPKYKTDIKTLNLLRKGIQNSKIIEGNYHNKKRILEPLGIIYGEKIYLVAKEKEKGDGIYNYLIYKFKDIKLTDKTFKRDNFNLQDYVNESFGIYHDEILDVELLFNKEIAEDVKQYVFHPTQTIIEKENKDVIVKFRASGKREIIRNIFKWGTNCKIIAPKELKDYYIQTLAENIENYK